MSVGGRLWRLLRGYAGDFNNVDPDELLERLFKRRRERGERLFEEDIWAEPEQAEQGRGGPARGGASDELRRAFARLELPVNTPLPEVKKAWRKLMGKYHPDRHQGDERRRKVATEVAAALTEAYHTIRSHYEGKS